MSRIDGVKINSKTTVDKVNFKAISFNKIIDEIEKDKGIKISNLLESSKKMELDTQGILQIAKDSFEYTKTQLLENRSYDKDKLVASVQENLVDELVKQLTKHIIDEVRKNVPDAFSSKYSLEPRISQLPEFIGKELKKGRTARSTINFLYTEANRSLLDNLLSTDTLGFNKRNPKPINCVLTKGGAFMPQVGSFNPPVKA